MRRNLRAAHLTTVVINLSVLLAYSTGALADGAFRSSISSAHVDLGETFTFFFLMLGPMKILGPFVKMTEKTGDGSRKRLAVRATIFSCLALAAADFFGERTLQDYGVSLNVLMLTGGLVLSAVAFQTILEQFRPVHANETEPETSSLDSGVLRLVFPTIVTPYGVAAVIILTAVAADAFTKIAILLIALGVLLLDLFAMLIARPLLKWLGAPLLLLNSVLAIIQLAFGVQIIVGSLGAIGMFPHQSQ